MVNTVSEERRREALLVELLKYKNKAVKAKELAPALGLNPDWSYNPVKGLVKALNERFIELNRPVTVVDTPKGYIYTDDPSVVREALEVAEKRLREYSQEVEAIRSTLRRLASAQQGS